MNQNEKDCSEANRWEDMFNRLHDFRESKGHCYVPANHEKDPELAVWVVQQRRQYNSDRSGHGTMPQERRKGLKEIDFEGKANHPRCMPWEIRFKQLLEFVVHNGHAHVPIGWKKNVQLSHWVSAQRQDFKAMQKGRAPTRLSPTRINLLNSIGFIWNAQRGGRKRTETDGRVSLPRFHDTAKKLSPLHQLQAIRLLQVFHQGANTQSSVARSVLSDSIPVKPMGATAHNKYPKLKNEPINQIQGGALMGQTIESGEKIQSSPVYADEWLRNHMIQAAIANEADFLNINNVPQLEATRQIVDSPIPSVITLSQVQKTAWQPTTKETALHPLSNPSGFMMPIKTPNPPVSQLDSFLQSELHTNPSLSRLQPFSSRMPQSSVLFPNPNDLTSSVNALNLALSSAMQYDYPFGAMQYSGLSDSCSGTESSTGRETSANSLGSQPLGTAGFQKGTKNNWLWRR